MEMKNKLRVIPIKEYFFVLIENSCFRILKMKIKQPVTINIYGII
jgi:hypothetical protein